MGYAAYVPGRDELGKLHKSFVPYIFPHKEIRDFFTALKQPIYWPMMWT